MWPSVCSGSVSDLLARPAHEPEPLIPRVCVYVAYREGDGDVASDVFARALRYREHRERYDRRKGEPAAWLIGIARRSVGSHLAARSPVAADLLDSAAPGDLEKAAANG